ncbi:HDOD domain-containing protein [Trichlorobacter lovleyi]|uniref:Metal dependent phosphohydrolase n=1 Tax=Trichlorobacter lovleyi (strain ATCC BAA-1151 / DSM 17278 / SZ) TaxID=398767 RepID=B3EB93_TRIL1|nr:HDOD domain-containing protein [Trichlorobacter lovleyi]ACD95487.1 metal dependent phosphohydrolase [Trichlorobacter lovleyi SZ]
MPMSLTPLSTAQAIMKTFKVLPTVPAAASRAIQLLNESEVDMGEVADILLADQVMAARVIRIVNSPLYKLLQEIDSVRQALIYLGPQRVFEIILTSCFLELTDSQSRTPLKMQSCWEHAFGVGLVAKKLASFSDDIPQDQAYIAGILHDIGEVILSQQRRDEFTRVLVLARERELDLYQAEMKVFGTSHAEVGALLAEQWRFPEVYIDVIRNHHGLQSGNMSTLTRLVHIADQICLNVGFCCKYGNAEQREGQVYGIDMLDLERQLSSLGVKRLSDFRASLAELVQQVKQTVESIYG